MRARHPTVRAPIPSPGALFAAACAALILLAWPAGAAPEEQEPSKAQQDQAQRNKAPSTAHKKRAVVTSDERLALFADAVLAVQKVDAKYRSKLAMAPTEAAKNELLQQANKEMIATIESVGLTVEEYAALSEVVQSDEKTSERFSAILAARTKAAEEAQQEKAQQQQQKKKSKKSKKSKTDG